MAKITIQLNYLTSPYPNLCKENRHSRREVTMRPELAQPQNTRAP